jgi:hypothetical protein
VLASAGDKHTEEYDATVSPNNESASETDDSDAYANYAPSEDSYSDSSENKSSSFDVAKVAALDEPQNIDLAVKKESRKPKSRKRKIAAPSEWKNKIKLNCPRNTRSIQNF